MKESFNKEIWISFVIKSIIGTFERRLSERDLVLYAMRIVSSRHRFYRLLSAIDFYSPSYRVL